jgi:putative ABC transport system permease protein
VLLALLIAVIQTQDSTLVDRTPNPRTIAIDESLAARAGLKVGDTVTLLARPAAEDYAVITAAPGGYTPPPTVPEMVVVSAIVRRSADPSQVSRGDLVVRMHLDQLQQLSGYGDRVDRFAIATTPSANTSRVLDRINAAAFGFQAYRSRDIAVETSRTFQVVSRFHRAIGLITIVASSVFLLCIMVLKVEERRRDIAALRLMGISRFSIVRSIVLEAAIVAVLGSMLGVVIGWAVSLFVNWHYQGLYRTPLEFSIVTTPIVGVAVALSLLLGAVAGIFASLRLVRTHPLTLLGR